MIYGLALPADMVKHRGKSLQMTEFYRDCRNGRVSKLPKGFLSDNFYPSGPIGGAATDI